MGCLVNAQTIKDAIGNTSFYKKLASKFGNEQGSFESCLFDILDTNLKQTENNELIPQASFKSDFAKWYKDHYNKDLPGISRAYNDSFINAVLLYNTREGKNGNITKTSKDNKPATNYIGGEFTRSEVIGDIQGIILDKYIDFVFNKNGNSSIRTKNDWENAALVNITAHLGSLVGIKNGDEIKSILKKNEDLVKDLYSQYIKITNKDKALKSAQMRTVALYIESNYNNLSEQTINTIEAIKEITNFDNDVNDKKVNQNFFDSVWNSKTLFGIVKTNQFDDYDEAKAVDEEDNSNGFNLELTDDEVKEFDESIRVFENHSGINYSSFMLHIDEDIRLYLSSLPKCISVNSDGTVVKDTSTVLGIPKKLDGSFVAAILYSMTEKGNVNDLIDSINKVAQSIPDLSALKILADNLSKDMDLAYNFYCNFGKYIMQRNKISVNEEGVTNKVSNNFSDRRSALNFTFENNLKNTILSNNRQISKEEYDLLYNKINARKKINSNLTESEVQYYIDGIYKVFKRYYSDITKNAIENYIKFTKVDNKINLNNNISSLLNDVKDTINSANDAEERYLEKQVDYRSKKKANNEAIEMNESPKYDLSNFWNDDILTDKDKIVAYNLASKLLPYSVAKVELTVSNVFGNNSSAVQNPNFLTRFMDMLSSTLNNTDYNESPLKQFAKDKLRGKGFKFSNILIERKEGNEIVNYGLFYEKDGSYYPTNYAQQLLSVHLLDGVVNNDNGEVMQWSQMKNPDAIITSIESFFNTEKAHDTVNKLSYADYILKTPSDAPNNYFLRAPRYSINGLFEIDRNVVNDRINKLLDKFSFIEYNEKDLSYNVSNYARKISTDQLIDLINGDLKTIDVPNLLAIPFSQKTKGKKDSDAKILTVECLTDNSKDPIRINLVGSIDMNTRQFTITGMNIISEGAGQNSSTYQLKEIIREGIEFKRINIDDEGNKLDLRFNKNHPIFKQLYNVFKHEMQDAADAISVIFSTDDKGRILLDEQLNPVINPNFYNGEGNILDNLYAHYHYNKADGKLVKNVNGRNVLTGRVFGSEEFTIIDKNGDKVNYMNDIISDKEIVTDSSISFLYGGAGNGNAYLHINSDGEVYFTKEQNDAIEKAISNFIYNYIISSKESVDKYSELDHKTPFSYSKIGEWALNYFIMYNNTSELFEGNSKFYKDVAQTSKREKEIQGAGTPYALYDVNNIILGNDEEKREVENAYLNKKEIQYQLKPLGEVKQYDRFKAVTVKNVVRKLSDSKDLKETRDILKKELIEAIKNNKIDAKYAEKLADAILSGYDKITADDAQSYITFEEWIRRIAAKGQLKKYMPLINKILDETQPISAEDLDAFVQVQKNFYYDMYYDEVFGKHMPRQIKNAEFVLIPRFIKGTELETVYNLMKDAGIDQLNTEETSKAAKKQVLTLWNEDGSVNTDSFNKNNIIKSSQSFSYNYLYEQQVTPQHVNKENKAALQIVKKILDNINENSPYNVKQAKEAFLNAFSQNIYGDFEKLMSDLGVELDENGNLKLDEGGKINGLDPELILDKIGDEFIRTGSDSNLMDFVTLNESISDFGVSMKMPAIYNTLRRKIENVAQSVINNNITRQTLKGSHLAQITSVGFSTIEHTKDKIIRSKDLHYHKTKDGKYSSSIDVKVAPSVVGLNPKDFTSQEEMLQFIDNYLDKFIGYRIPTEGKQSIAVMKVAGFLDDSQGSTIAVPDEWVAQTGSDFDIDSIYTINYETYGTEKGIRKIQFKDNYVDLYVNNIVSYLYNEEDYEKVDKLFETSKLTKEEKEGLSKEEIFEKERELLLSNAEIVAAEEDLDNFEDFKIKNRNKDVYALNSKKARSNKMLDSMIEILEDQSSLEENLSRSNFDDIIEARDRLLEGTSIEKRRKNKNANNIVDQLDLHTSYSSGAILKGISVMRDRFNSINNTVRGKLSTPLKVMHHLNDDEYKLAVDAFGEVEAVEGKPGYYIINHDMWGWSLNNRNIVGKILTSYSSQTTAHNLDAVKEGDVPNVNDQTFGVYKTFIDLGCDYELAISFMLQPIISELVDAMDTTNSIYSSRNINPLNEVYRNIARRLNINSTGDINTVKNNIKQYIEKNKLFDLNEALNKEELINRIHSKNSSPVKEEIAMDYYILSKYEELKRTSDAVERTIRVLNPDKFGGKPSLFETYKTFDDIFDLIDSGDALVIYTEKDGKKISMLESVYPGIKQDNVSGTDERISAFVKYNGTVKDSTYPPLYYFLKYATATSIKLNTLLFPTQTPEFRSAVNSLAYIIDRPLSKDLYTKFESYLLTNIYQNTRLLSNPVSYSKTYGIQPVEIVDYTTDRRNELRRIFGYGKNAGTYMSKNGENVKFEPEDIYNPTEEEVNKFATLFSPAQKVAWMQEHFKDSLICNYLKPILYVGNYREKVAGSQLIEFNFDVNDKEIVYKEFYNTFHNSNPLFTLTAIDIIKYAFAVEGYDISKRAVNKVIDNDILIDLGLRDEIVDAIGNFISNRTLENDAYIEGISPMFTVVENFLRSHNDIKELTHVVLNKANKTIFNNHKIEIANKIEGTKKSDVIKLDISDNDAKDFILNNKIGNILENVLYPKQYIVINKTLYKIEPFGGVNEGNGCYLYPLNGLQTNEVDEVSSNDTNNKYYTKEYYKEIIKADEAKTLNQYIDVTQYTIEKQRKGIKFASPITDADAKSNAKDYNKLVQEIRDSLIDKNNKVAFIWDPTNALLKIKAPHVGNKTEIEIDGKTYIIHRIHTDKLTKYTGSKINSPIESIDKDLESIIEKHRNLAKKLGHSVLFNNVYKIVEVQSQETTEEENVLASAVSEGLITADEHIVKIANSSDDEAANRYKNSNRTNNIKSNRASIEVNELTVAIATAGYVLDKVPTLIQDLIQFYKDDETGDYLSATDDKIFELIKDNPALNRKLLKLLLDCNSLINKFSIFDNALYEDNEKDVKIYIDKIKKEVDKLKNNKIYQNLERKYVDLYLDKISNNPLVKKDLISITDSYHVTNGFMANVADVQSSNNQIVQVILSDVLSDIRGKEVKADREVGEFQNKIKEISAKGHVDWSKIIDENGVFIRDYSQKFVDDYYDLTANKEIADIVFKEVNTEYLEYLQSDNIDKEKVKELNFKRFLAYKDVEKARLALSKWRIKNVNQELNDISANKLLELDEKMLNESPSIYIEYKLLENDKKKLLSGGNSELDEDFYNKLNEINRRISQLSSSVIFLSDDEFENKKDYKKEPTNADIHAENLKSRLSAKNLETYLDARRRVLSSIYEEKAKLGFEELKDKYLNIINKKEALDANGNKKSISELMEDPDYVEAKHWLKRNARFEWGYTFDDRNYTDAEGNPSILPTSDILLAVYDEYAYGTKSKYTETDNIVAAMEFFKSSRGHSSNSSSVYKTLAKNKDAYDEFGVIDGTKFTDAEIASIKKEQEDRYSMTENRIISENNIMHNSKEKELVVYRDAFWNSLKLGGKTNEEYKQVVIRINKILATVYNPETQKIETSKLTEEQLKTLLDEFKNFGYEDQIYDKDKVVVKKKQGVSSGRIKQYSEFVQNNIEFVTDDETFNKERLLAQAKGVTYYNLWMDLNREWDVKENTFKPNHMLWGDARLKEIKRDDFETEEAWIKAKKKQADLYIDTKRTAALRIIKQSFNKTTTQYYEKKNAEMSNRTYEDYKAWFDANHVYDPHSGTLIPLPIWIKNEPNESVPGKWVPTYNMEDKFIKPDKLNKNYIKDGGIFGNFKTKEQKQKDIEEYEKQDNTELDFDESNINKYYPDSDYYNSKVETLNSTEKELLDYLQETLLKYANTKQGRKFLLRGNLPNRVRIDKDNLGTFVVKEFAKAAGWIEGNQGNDRWESIISYDEDYVPDMPMLTLLKKSSGEDVEEISRPVRGNEQTLDEYRKEYANYIKQRRAKKEADREERSKIIDNNWVDVISEYIKRASHFNAVQENKYKYYFGQRLLEDYGSYIERDKRKGFGKELINKKRLNEEDTPYYIRKVDENLKDQYDNFGRRLLYQQFKQPQGTKTRILQVLQSITSTQYMTINVHGGVANVTVGESNIIAEAFAENLFGTKEYIQGKGIWLGAIADFLAHLYDDKAGTKAGAIVKAMNILDFTELTGQVKELSPEELSKRLRDMAFAMLSTGEHFMQNGAMFSMMLSHRVVIDVEGKVDIMNLDTFVGDAAYETLLEMLTDEEIIEFNKFKEEIRKDANKTKDYANFRQDITTRFVVDKFSKERRAEFIKNRKQKEKQKEEDFNKFSTLWDNLALGDNGKMIYAQGSILARLHNETANKEISDADKLIGKFRNKVISANGMIHGWYDKYNAAKIENTWWGGIVMQYHKHILPGILKRYRTHGYFNEFRDTVDKGFFTSIIDFIKLDLDLAYKNGDLDDEQHTLLKGLQNIVTFGYKFIMNAKQAYDLLPEYDRENIRRSFGDLSGMFIAVNMAIIANVAGGSDDDEFLPNFVLYQADRLATECGMWTPFGAVGEARKLWSSPIAAQSILTDLLNMIGTTTNMLFNEDFDPYYHSGKYAGQHKASVYFQRRIPYWRNIMTLRDMPKNNRFYKLGDNIFSIIPVKNIAEYISDFEM